MTIEEKIREIMLSEELPDSEELDRLHALIPADAFKIDKLNGVFPRPMVEAAEMTGSKHSGMRAYGG
jgi:hypothetical protein